MVIKVIIYGLGSGRENIEKCLKSEHEIIGYTDSYSNIKIFAGKRFYLLHELKNVEFDYIILAVGNEKICMEIKDNLVSNLNINKVKIVEFWKLYYFTLTSNVIDYRICENNYNYDGVVMGISHAEAGIDTKYLDGRWVNLAISHQDLYGNKKVLKYVFSKYKDYFANLEYVIIDLFDYVYFNYDVSMANAALDYLAHVFNIEEIEHNFKQNKQCDELKKKANTSYLYAKEKVLSEMEQNYIYTLFNDIHEDRYMGELKIKYSFIRKDEDDYMKPDYMPAFSKKRFPQTIKENIDNFKEILDMLLSINSEMKIWAILIPRYYTIEEIHKNLYVDWKREFEKIIYELKKEYNFNYINYKEYTPISSNNNFYADVAHLNKAGAIAFTSMLNETLINGNAE